MSNALEKPIKTPHVKWVARISATAPGLRSTHLGDHHAYVPECHPRRLRLDPDNRLPVQSSHRNLCLQPLHMCQAMSLHSWTSQPGHDERRLPDVRPSRHRGFPSQRMERGLRRILLQWLQGQVRWHDCRGKDRLHLGQRQDSILID